MKFRSQVFKRAHEIARSTGKSFAICLVKAWECYRLKKAMLSNKVRFAYEKADGSLRYAWGTLKGELGIKGTGKGNLSTVAYFDIEANGFRSFRAGNLIRIY
ncbi:SH3 beta-barrel fold-containing protein [Maribacter flavus]|uniref:DUF2693 domain-containing protein n=1 Tax=Maribacter flavus TaxID=1658664 RepID=A0A5B2TVY0_9FLAO|nr:SH3 beta-barrel fold-containing protein [Maribacter flavus]KAA2218534.1 DUF2693 domain-containing protein [Maribacter flavus]